MGEATTNKMKIGDSMPSFPSLPGVDQCSYSAESFNTASVLVIFFSCNHCPYVQASEDRLIALQKEFMSQGVRFVAINSNDAVNYPEDSFDNMVKRSHERRFNFVYLRDESQNVARSFGASHTPQIFVFDHNRKLVYTGKIDDNPKDPTAVKTRFLHDVLADLVQGKSPRHPETLAIGCSIKWR